MGKVTIESNRPVMVDHLKLFVYGSLKVKECNHRVIERYVQSWEKAELRGDLRLRPDKYPALFLSEPYLLGTNDYDSDLTYSTWDRDRPESQESFVAGQILTLHSGAAALKLLDEFEGFFPGGLSEYLRVGLHVQSETVPKFCWTYIGASVAPNHWLKLKSWPPEGLQRDPEPYAHGLGSGPNP